MNSHFKDSADTPYKIRPALQPLERLQALEIGFELSLFSRRLKSSTTGRAGGLLLI
jgi:hypothetical protein